jgi:hypothetical protein
MDDDPISDMVRSFAQIPADIKTGTTHCFNFSLELLRNSEHFKKIESHFDADALVCTYMCLLDNRKYIVKVIPT